MYFGTSRGSRAADLEDLVSAHSLFSRLFLSLKIQTKKRRLVDKVPTIKPVYVYIENCRTNNCVRELPC